MLDAPTDRPDRGMRIDLDPERVEHGLIKLVLAVIELIRQLLERQALRRMEGGTLTAEEIERIGTALMRLEAQIGALQAQFDIDDLNIGLGPLGKLLDD